MHFDKLSPKSLSVFSVDFEQISLYSSLRVDLINIRLFRDSWYEALPNKATLPATHCTIFCVSTSPAVVTSLTISRDAATTFVNCFWIFCSEMSDFFCNFDKMFHNSTFTDGTESLQFLGKAYFARSSFSCSLDFSDTQLFSTIFAQFSLTSGPVPSLASQILISFKMESNFRSGHPQPGQHYLKVLKVIFLCYYFHESPQNHNHQ